MRLTKQSLLYVGIALWGVAVMLSTILLFFPYQKALKIVSQNLLGSSRIIVALEGPRFGFISAQASRVVIGHVAVEGRPLFELRKIDARWHPLSLLTGRLAIFCRALAYDGMVECSIDGIPVLAKGSPYMKMKFENVNLAKYPEGTLPWFKGMSGSMSGWIKEEMPLERSDKQKGSFRIIMTAGEIKDVQIKGLRNFVLPYKEVVAEGRISGSKIYVDKIVVDGEGIRLNGNGTLESGGDEQRVNLTLTCENTSQISPLANGSVITVTGNQWSPTITISTEPVQHGEKVAARNYRAQAGLTL
ncbi:MAG: type II secretion system protein GspN [Syntrophorhabdales bacterium]|jgi:type II secretion system protein N